MAQRLEEAKKKDELRKKQQEKRLKLAAEERRLKDLQKVCLKLWRVVVLFTGDGGSSGFTYPLSVIVFFYDNRHLN